MFPTWLVDRGEIVSFVLVTLALVLSARVVARVTGSSDGPVEDVYWTGGILFLVVGRLLHVATISPALLTDIPVLIRFPDGIDPLGGATAALAWALWKSRGAADAPLWAAAVAGMVLAAATYDLSCFAREACYGIPAPAPFGFPMHGLAESRLPTPLIEGALLLALLGVATQRLNRWPVARLGWGLLASLALVRLAMLPLTVQGVAPLDAGVLAAVVVVSAGLAARRSFTRPVSATEPPGAS